MKNRGLTPNHIVDSVVPLDLHLSPDGNRVAYSVVPVSRAGRRAITHIWVADTSGNLQSFPLTSGKSENRFPRWHPAGSRIAFLSDRDAPGIRRLYSIEANGGAATRLGDFKSAVQLFDWSLDGSSIVFTGADESAAGSDAGDAAPFRSARSYARLRRLAVDTGMVTTLVACGRHITRFAISPDGREIAYHSWRTPAADSEDEETTIESIPLTGGEPRLVCRFPKAVRSLAWSGDGRLLLFVAPLRNMTPSSWGVFSVAASGGAPQRLAYGVRSCAIKIEGSRQEPETLVLAGEGLDTKLCRVDPRTGAARTWYSAAGKSLDGDAIDTAARCDSDGGASLAVIHGTGRQPWEIWAATHCGRTDLPVLRPITCHNARIASIPLGSQEPFFWTSRDGLQLDGVLIRPPDLNKSQPLPMIMLAHGGPYDRWGLGFHSSWVDWGQWLACGGYAVLMPNPRGGFGHGQGFAAAVSGCPSESDYPDLIEALDAAVQRGIADPARIGIGGWSYGGFLAAWAVTQTTRFRAALVGAGITDWGAMVMGSDRPTDDRQLAGRVPWDEVPRDPVKLRDPIRLARRVQTPVMLIHGERDTRVPSAQSIGFYRALIDCGVPSELVIYPRESHFIRERQHAIDLLVRIRSWFDRWVLSPGRDR